MKQNNLVFMKCYHKEGFSYPKASTCAFSSLSVTVKGYAQVI